MTDQEIIDQHHANQLAYLKDLLAKLKRDPQLRQLPFTQAWEYRKALAAKHGNTNNFLDLYIKAWNRQDAPRSPELQEIIRLGLETEKLAPWQSTVCPDMVKALK